MNAHKISSRTFAFAVLAVVLVLVPIAWGDVVSIKFTAEGLGLGTNDINKEKSVDADVPGLITSDITGEGSILSVLLDGQAGNATVTNPLLVTVTAQEHLDTVSGLPSPNDYQAGVLFISKEASDTPDGRKEGLGVKAFTVDGPTALRVFDTDGKDPTYRAKIEGSKHVSGGTGPTAYDPESPNGPPHVDEAVKFDFNAALDVNAQSVVVLLSDYDVTNIVDLHIKLTTGTEIDLPTLLTTDTTLFEEIGDKLWKLKFSGIGSLESDDLVDWFTIRANDDDPDNPKGTAEHFFIAGLTVDAVPEPTTVALLALGGLGLLCRRRRSRGASPRTVNADAVRPPEETSATVKRLHDRKPGITCSN